MCIYIYYVYNSVPYCKFKSYMKNKHLFGCTHTHTHTHTRVFDKFIWCTIGLKCLLFGTVQFSFWERWLIMIILHYHFVNWLSNCAHTLRFSPCFKAYQKLSHTHTYGCTSWYCRAIQGCWHNCLMICQISHNIK